MCQLFSLQCKYTLDWSSHKKTISHAHLELWSLPPYIVIVVANTMSQKYTCVSGNLGCDQVTITALNIVR